MTIEELKNNGWKDENDHLWNDPDNNNWILYKMTEVEPLPRKYFIPYWFIGEQSDLLIGHLSIKSVLSEHGRSLEEYYSRFILNLSDVPTCENEGCNNKVHVRDGKIPRGLTKCCCRSCHISKRNRKLWKDPDYIMNSSEFKFKKSQEMTNNLMEWNYNPEFQARSKRGKILSHVGVNYIFYISRTLSGFLKFGVAQDGTTDWRLYVQKEFNGDEYVSFHTIFKSDNIRMADFEYNLKSKFGFREYMDWSEFKKLKNEIRNLSK